MGMRDRKREREMKDIKDNVMWKREIERKIKCMRGRFTVRVSKNQSYYLNSAFIM